MTSPLSRAMSAIGRILDAADADTGRQRDFVDPFVATTWCLAEIDELSEKVARLSATMKVARLNRDLVEARRIGGEMRRAAFQMHEMALTASSVLNRGSAT